MYIQANKNVKSKDLIYKIKKILDEVSELSRTATNFIHACDYDQEGEVIGYNILEYACKNKYAESKRAKFSSLTDEEILNSFNNLLPSNHKLKDAGVARHIIDFIYGINLSRALTNSIKKAPKEENNKGFIQLSIGRVQGPTLAFVVEREKEISAHVPNPYWNIYADFQKNDKTLKAYYFPQKIESKDIAQRIISECKNQSGIVSDLKIIKTAIKPPNPFNLGDLQKESFRVFRFTPSYTLSIAEKLYLDALISYPRTSSQKLPPSINYNKIISNISKSDLYVHTGGPARNIVKNKVLSYSDISSKLLSQKNLFPNEGKQDDPAHPAIYPTGEKPKRSLEDSESKLLDLIVRRFFSTFGPEASYSQILVTITVKDKHIFKTEEKKILSEGWIEYYRPYFDFSNYVTADTLSFLKKNDILKLIKIESIEKTTQPPPRYNQSTLLQKMEREKIGTKATRSEIINTLFKRNYVYNFVPRTLINSQPLRTSQSIVPNKNGTGYNSKGLEPIAERHKQDKPVNISTQVQGSAGIRPTQMGIALIESMQKYVPSIVSTSLTRFMEEQLEQVESGNKNSAIVIDQARDQVKQAIKSFTKNQEKIAMQISLSLENDRANTAVSKRGAAAAAIITLGKCPICQKGNLVVKKSIKSKKRFAGCTNYSSNKCTATSPLPLKGALRGSGKSCEACKWPIVSSTGINQGKKYQWQFCINSQCPSKKNSIK